MIYKKTDNKGKLIDTSSKNYNKNFYVEKVSLWLLSGVQDSVIMPETQQPIIVIILFITLLT